MFKKNVVMKPGSKVQPKPALNDEDRFEAQIKDILNIVGQRFSLNDIRRLHCLNAEDINLTIRQLKHEQENLASNYQNILAHKLTKKQEIVLMKTFKSIQFDTTRHFTINKLEPVQQHLIDSIVFAITITEDTYTEMYKNFSKLSKDAYIESQM